MPATITPINPVSAPDQETPIGYFLCLGCQPSQYLDSIPKFITNVRKHFEGFSEKDFIAPLNLRTDPKLHTDMITQLDLLKVSRHFCMDSDDYLEIQIKEFCQKYTRAYIVLIACNESFCQRIIGSEELSEHQKYLIHDLKLEFEDSSLMESATVFSFDYFLDKSPDADVAREFDLVKASQQDTPLIFLVDIENIPQPQLLGLLINEVLKYFIGFDVQKYVAALTTETYNNFRNFRDELHKLTGLELHCVEMKKNSADNYLTDMAMTRSREHPNARFVIITSDSDFCPCIVKLRYRYNHKVYLIHNVNVEKSLAYNCMLPQATQAIAIKFFLDKIKVFLESNEAD